VIENPSVSNPFAITITNNGDGNDADELVYVTNLFAEYVPGSAPRPSDDLGKQGIVNVINVGTDSFIDRVALGPVKTNFKSNGKGRTASADGINPSANPNDFQVDTFAFPKPVDFNRRNASQRNQSDLHFRHGFVAYGTDPLQCNDSEPGVADSGPG
jgi:hypothetical protein